MKLKISQEEDSCLLVIGIEQSLSAEWFRELWTRELLESLGCFLTWLFACQQDYSFLQRGTIQLIELKEDGIIRFSTSAGFPLSGPPNGEIKTRTIAANEICCLFQLKDWDSHSLCAKLQEIFGKQGPKEDFVFG
jgi:hypothetical protein